MSDAVSPIPTEFGSLVVELTVSDVVTAVRFYQAAFGAYEVYRNQLPGDPRVFHCEVLIGSARLMLHDEFMERGLPSPIALGGTPVTMHLYVPDVDATFAAALQAGARLISKVERRFWGMKSGVCDDPFGHRWNIVSRLEDLAPEEVMERAAKATPNDRLPVGKSGIRP